MKAKEPKLSASDASYAAVFDAESLRQKARWIRDELDPQVARDGPDALHSDEILTLDEFLRQLLHCDISKDDIRYSRIHHAISKIAGRATRWPKRLIDRCEALKEAWEARYGPLKDLGILLYEPRGRLHGICRPEDVSKEKIMIKWLKAPTVKLSPLTARKCGDMGFKPGDWWINPLFAFRDGIIDHGEADGGITADSNGAYAVLMTEEDELQSPGPETFTYRAKEDDRGRYRLTSGSPESRNSIRVLRSHSLRGFWAPKVGLRYDGLYKVSGWSIKKDPVSKKMVYDITFRRLPNEPSMDAVLRRPLCEEVEDYREYKRQRQLMQDKQEAALQAERAKRNPPPTLLISVDGSADPVVEVQLSPHCAQVPFVDPVEKDPPPTRESISPQTQVSFRKPSRPYGPHSPRDSASPQPPVSTLLAV